MSSMLVSPSYKLNLIMIHFVRWWPRQTRAPHQWLLLCHQVSGSPTTWQWTRVNRKYTCSSPRSGAESTSGISSSDASAHLQQQRQDEAQTRPVWRDSDQLPLHQDILRLRRHQRQRILRQQQWQWSDGDLPRSSQQWQWLWYNLLQ